MLVVDRKINRCLAGRILFPERPILCLCTLVVDTNVRNSTMRCFYIYQRGQTIAVVCPFETPTRRFRPHIDLLSENP